MIEHKIIEEIIFLLGEAPIPKDGDVDTEWINYILTELLANTPHDESINKNSYNDKEEFLHTLGYSRIKDEYKGCIVENVHEITIVLLYTTMLVRHQHLFKVNRPFIIEILDNMISLSIAILSSDADDDIIEGFFLQIHAIIKYIMNMLVFNPISTKDDLLFIEGSPVEAAVEESRKLMKTAMLWKNVIAVNINTIFIKDFHGTSINTKAMLEELVLPYGEIQNGDFYFESPDKYIRLTDYSSTGFKHI